MQLRSGTGGGQSRAHSVGSTPFSFSDSRSLLLFSKIRYTSPFQLEAERAGKDHRGGKLDDVTILASLVTKDAPMYSIVSA